MQKKQPIAKASVTSATPARVAKSRPPRVTTAKHSKAQAIEPTVEVAVEEIAAPVAAVTVSVTPEIAPAKKPAKKSDPREAIAKIAYGYWAARGYAGGSAHEDWIRAEAEYLSR